MLKKVDAVVHLARPSATLRASATRSGRARCSGATRTLRAAPRVSRFFASTCSNYGKMEDGSGYVSEDWDLRPVSLYAETRSAAELDVLAASDDRFATTCLRFATVYGTSPRMRFDLTVNEFTRDAFVSGELVVYGEQFWRPYIHVRDAARAIVTVLEAPAGACAARSSMSEHERELPEAGSVGSCSSAFRRRASSESPRPTTLATTASRSRRSRRSWATRRGPNRPRRTRRGDRALRADLVGDPFSAAFGAVRRLVLALARSE